MVSPEQLKAEVLSIVNQLSHDELRVFRLMGRRMIDIGHAKYGALNLSSHARRWTREQAQETSDRLFYEQCHELAKEDSRSERLDCFKHDRAYAAVDAALNDFVSASPDDRLVANPHGDLVSSGGAGFCQGGGTVDPAPSQVPPNNEHAGDGAVTPHASVGLAGSSPAPDTVATFDIRDGEPMEVVPPGTVVV